MHKYLPLLEVSVNICYPDYVPRIGDWDSGVLFELSKDMMDPKGHHLIPEFVPNQRLNTEFVEAEHDGSKLV